MIGDPFVPVILRRPHTRTAYTDDPDAIPYRGRFDHEPRPYLTGVPVLDTLGRHNGMTHTWLSYECANVGCRFLLLVWAEHAHDLAWREVQARQHAARFSGPARALDRFRENLRTIGQAIPVAASTDTLTLGASDD